MNEERLRTFYYRMLNVYEVNQTLETQNAMLGRFIEELGDIIGVRIGSGLPEIGSRWKRKGGNEYVVIEIANRGSASADYPVMVIYRSPNNNVKALPLSCWYESMTELSR